MKTIRTDINFIEKKLFERFMKTAISDDILIGDYQDLDDRYYTIKKLCYAYPEKDDETVANLTHLILKYNNVESAFNDYKTAITQNNLSWKVNEYLNK